MTKPVSTILAEASGFVYYVSVLGITGTKSAAGNTISDAYQRIRAQTELPIVAGFASEHQHKPLRPRASQMGQLWDLLVDIIANNLTDTRKKVLKMILFKKLPLLWANLRQLFANRGYAMNWITNSVLPKIKLGCNQMMCQKISG